MSDTLSGGELDAVGVSFDRDHEPGEVAVADDPPELLLGDESQRFFAFLQERSSRSATSCPAHTYGDDAIASESLPFATAAARTDARVDGRGLLLYASTRSLERVDALAIKRSPAPRS